MKQIELELKKRLLIVEAPRLKDFVIERINIPIVLRVGDESVKLKCDPDSEFKLICKGSELTEKIISTFFKFPFKGYFLTEMSGDKIYTADLFRQFKDALETAGFYWGENPIGRYEKINFFKASENTPTLKEWQEAESKTFNPEKTLIFEIL